MERGRQIIMDKKISIQFTVITFLIAYVVAGGLIIAGQNGYEGYNWGNKF